jgi:hypothetical protein
MSPVNDQIPQSVNAQHARRIQAPSMSRWEGAIRGYADDVTQLVPR